MRPAVTRTGHWARVLGPQSLRGQCLESPSGHEGSSTADTQTQGAWLLRGPELASPVTSAKATGGLKGDTDSGLAQLSADYRRNQSHTLAWPRGA